MQYQGQNPFQNGPGISFQMPQVAGQDTEAMRQKRYRGLRGLRKLSIAMMVISFIAFACGIATFVFAAPNLTFPFAWGGAIIPGILVFISGLLGSKAAEKGLKEEEPSAKLKCIVIGQYVLSVTAISLSFLSMGYAAWSLTACQSEEGDEGCLPNKKENSIMAVLNLILGLMLGILCILGTCFFCCFGRTLGFRSRMERRMQMQMQLLQAQMTAQQSQAQGQAWSDAPPPYPGHRDRQSSYHDQTSRSSEPANGYYTYSSNYSNPAKF